MPLSKEDYLFDPTLGPMPEAMRSVVQKCCGFSNADCRGDCEVVDSKLKDCGEQTLSDTDLARQMDARDPALGVSA